MAEAPTVSSRGHTTGSTITNA